ncbi:MAG: GC-type dockerin domain-anchored protein [Phycisphaerales bacterium]
MIRLHVIATLAVAASGVAAQPIQTDFDAQFYLLDSNSGMIASGSLAMGTVDSAFDTPIGNNASGLDLLPDGRLVASGNIGSTLCIAVIDPETGATDPILTNSDVFPGATFLPYFRGVTVAPDGTLYTFLGLATSTSSTHLVHFTHEGEVLSLVRVQDSGGNDILWHSRAYTVRSDGMIVSVDTALGSLKPPPAEIATIDPETGLLEVIAIFDEEDGYCRGLSRIGATAFVNLGDAGDQIYTLDLFSGELEYVMSITDATGSIPYAFGFAIAPDPCPADMTYDDAINIGDIEMFIDRFLEGSTAADLDYSRTNNFDDLDIFIDSFLNGCGD